MNCHVVIPVKLPDKAKVRLAGVLSVAQRADLANAMLRHVLAAAQAADHVQHIALLGPSRLGLDIDIALLVEFRE